MNLIKFAAPAAVILSAAAFTAGYTLPAIGVLAGAAVSLANFYFLEKIVKKSLNLAAPPGARIPAFKMIVKTAASVAALFGCVYLFGAPGVFAGILTASVSLFGAGKRVKS